MDTRQEYTKNSVIRCRIEKDIHQEFKEVCKRGAFNPSELLRQWIIKFIKDNKG